MNLEEQVSQYSAALVYYEAANKLPMDMLSQPDHLALKAADIRHFEILVKSVGKYSSELYCIDDQDRFLVAARLAGKVTVGLHGKVRWLEIKEPRRGHSDDIVGIEHAEFVYNDFNKALNQLERKGLDPEVEAEGDHKRINLVFTSEGHELRFTNTPIAEIVTEKLENGEAYVIKQAA